MKNERRQLLIIDDSQADTLVLQSLLKQAFPHDIDIVHKSTAGEGLAAIQAKQFDCVFLDYLLEDDSGLDWLRDVRTSGNDVPVIAYSGNGSEAVAVAALKLGAQDYMVKGSLTVEAVGRALSNAIEKVSLARRLEEKQQELDDFAHVAAHDLKGPLCTVHTLASVLLGGLAGQCDDKAIEILQRMDSGIMRMSKLLDSLLDYAEYGRSQKPFEPVNLNTVLTVALENLSAKIKSANAHVDYTPLPEIMGDEVALTQLLQNLLSNAIKFCRDRPPVVTVSAEQSDDNWIISVADNGIGIAPEHLEYIFAPFRRLHQQTEFEGSGIGLTTCRKVAKQHLGEICAESELGKGTTFRVTLPMHPTYNGGARNQSARLQPVLACEAGEPTNV